MSILPSDPYDPWYGPISPRISHPDPDQLRKAWEVMQQRLTQTAEVALPPMAVRVTCRTCKAVLWNADQNGHLEWRNVLHHLGKHVKEDGTAGLGVDVEAMVTW